MEPINQNCKRCTTCGFSYENPHSAFTKMSAKRDGLSPICKKCRQSKQNAWYRENRAAVRAKQKAYYDSGLRPVYRESAAVKKQRNLLANYGLTMDRFNQMLEAQDGGCKICGTHLHRPHVDHCHETGKVRGLLCNKCNAGLGMFQDDLFILESAMVYLRDAR